MKMAASLSVTRPTPVRRWLWRTLAWAATLAALAAVFMAYQNPHLARELASQLWACF